MKNKRRIIKRITKRKFEQFLNEVDWTIRHHGCGYYRLYNPYGKCSAFQFHASLDNKKGDDQIIYDLRIDEFEINKCNYQKPFGKAEYSCGLQSFLLDKNNVFLELTYNDDGTPWFVGIIAKDENKKDLAFITFSKK